MTKYFKFIISSFSNKDSSAVLLHRLVSVFSGLIVLYIVTSLLGIQDQGSYYLILSLVALQSFVDLGVISVMVSVILKDWTEFGTSNSIQIRDYKISTIRGYFHFFLKWYLSLSILLLLISIIYSYNFKNESELFNILICISIISSFNFFLNLFWLFLEGIGDYFSLYIFRTIQLVFSTVCLYFLIQYNFGVSSFFYFYCLTFLTSILFIIKKWSTFHLFIFGIRSDFLYFKEIFPFHFTVFIQSIFGYFTWQAIIPLFYNKLGPVVAGKLGVTVQIASLFLSFSTFLIYSKSPIFSKLLLVKNHDQIKSLWKKDLFLSYVLFFSFVLVYIFLFYFDFNLFKSFFNRGLKISNSLLIFFIHSFYIFNQSVAVLTRLNKKEILSFSGVLVPILSYALVFLGVNYLSLDMIFCLLFLLNALFFVVNYVRFKNFKSNYLSF